MSELNDILIEHVKTLKSLGVIRFDSDLARDLGYSKGNISSYLKGKLEPSRSFMEKFYKFYNMEPLENLSKNALHEPSQVYQKEKITLSPEGKVKRNKVLSGFNQVPYYDVDFIAGTNLETIDAGAIEPSYYMSVPIFKDCAAFNCYSDSMQPLIQKGNIIFCTHVNDWQDVLEFGQIYAISLHDNRRFLKYIVRHESKSDTHFLLRSENNHYDTFEVPKSKIKGIWLVHGWMNKQTQ